MSTKKNFLEISGDGNRETVVQSLLENKKMIKPREKMKMFKVERSPLLAKLESFLPALAAANKELDDLPEEERAKLSMEPADNEGSSSEHFVEMTVIESEQMQDSPVFQVLNLKKGAASVQRAHDSDSSSSSEEEDEGQGDKLSSISKKCVNKSKKIRIISENNVSDEDEAKTNNKLENDSVNKNNSGIKSSASEQENISNDESNFTSDSESDSDSEGGTDSDTDDS